MFTVLKAKLYPTPAQERRLVEYLDQGRCVYNSCLAQRRGVWKNEKKNISRLAQNRELAQERARNEKLRDVPSQVERDAIRRVELAFNGFFRNVKNKAKKPGYPRFKSINRYNSFTIAGCGNVVKSGMVRVSGVGLMRCRGLRPPEGEVRQLVVKRRAGEWFAHILVKYGEELPPLKPVTSAIGVDLGLKNFIATSNGETVACPKHYRRLSVKLRQANKRLARRRDPRSNRRKKALLQLQKIHAKIADCRMDFHHKLSRELVNAHQLIVAEKLNVKNLTRSKLAKSILDAGWSQFTRLLAYKAERAGHQFIQVNPAYTSQICSQCGALVPKALSERVHKCECGLVLDRDVNAARNILKRGLNPTSPPGNDGVTYAEPHKTSPAYGEARTLTRTGSP